MTLGSVEIVLKLGRLGQVTTAAHKLSLRLIEGKYLGTNKDINGRLAEKKGRTHLIGCPASAHCGGGRSNVPDNQ